MILLYLWADQLGNHTRVVRAGGRTSESKDGAKRDAQVVVRSVIKVDRVAKLESQPDRTQNCFRASAWIACRVKTGGTDAEDRTYNIAIRNETRAKPEIDEPTLESDKWDEDDRGQAGASAQIDHQ